MHYEHVVTSYDTASTSLVDQRRIHLILPRDITLQKNSPESLLLFCYTDDFDLDDMVERHGDKLTNSSASLVALRSLDDVSQDNNSVCVHSNYAHNHVRYIHVHTCIHEHVCALICVALTFF